MHGRGWYARCLIMMCSNLGFQEPSTNATRQRDGWAVRSNVHVASLLECGNGYATIILHFLTTRMAVTCIAVRMVGPKQRYLALGRLFRILMVRWATRIEIYYSA
jgi:hypothetical protein